MRSQFAAFVIFLAIAGVATAQTIKVAPKDSQGAVVGSVSAVVEADAAPCRAANTLTLATVVTNALGGTSRAVVLQTGVDTACRWRIDDLKAGTYEVDLSGERGTEGVAQFAVIPDKTTEVLIRAPAVTIFGRILLNGTPLTGARVLFQPGPASLRASITNANGTFENSTAEPGQYSVRLSGPALYLQGTRVTFTTGANTFIWNVKGSTLVIAVNNWDPVGAVDVQVVASNGSSQTHRIAWDGPSILVMRGVPAGVYQISTRHSVTQRSTAQAVTITDDNRELEIDFDPH
jgi:hypothetical protein